MNSGSFKMNLPFFSIIIPTYNSGKTLSLCLESILNQTFQNFEIIIIDGISSDDTVSIVKKFKEINPNIRWISEKDKGIYDAMNKGIRLAKGKWVYFMGSDDTIYSTDTLNKIRKELKDFDVVYGNVISTRFDGIYDGSFTKEKIYQKNICHQAIFFKKNVFKKIGKFNQRYSSHADWDHNLRWFLSDKIKKKYIDLIFANYADGGFSSVNAEPCFHKIKHWKYSVLNKKEIRFKDKVQLIQFEYNKAISEKRRRDAFMILFQTPYFLL